MISQSLKPQTKLWVVALGIIISGLIITPPCLPLKASANAVWEQVTQKTAHLLNSDVSKSDIINFLEPRQTD